MRLSSYLLLLCGAVGDPFFAESKKIDDMQNRLSERQARKAELDQVLKTLAEHEAILAKAEGG